LLTANAVAASGPSVWSTYVPVVSIGYADRYDGIRLGSFGECAACGGDVEPKRLEAIPWARYCVKCQEAREQG